MPATKKSVDFSINGEQEPNSVLSELDYSIGAGDANPESEVKNVIFKLVKANGQGGVWIPNIDDVVNPKTGKVERIRLLSGVDTIWQKEQKDLTPEFINQNGRSLHFPRGMRILVVPEWDTTMLEFARITRHNIGSDNKKFGSRFEFYEYDPQKQQKEQYEKEINEMKMVMEAQKLPEEQMRKIASYMGIMFHDELAQPKSEEGIRTELMLKAKKNPSLFERLLSSKKEVDTAFLVKTAIISNRIELKQNAAHWAKTGVRICGIPATIKPLQHLTEHALSNTQDGKEFLEQLQQNIT